MLTPKQARIVKAKVDATIKDVPQRKWATGIYPDANPRSAEVLVSRELNKVNVQEALQTALEKHGLTADSVVGAVGDAMGAKKVVEGAIVMEDGTVHKSLVETDVADHSIRLKAASMAAQFMGLSKQNEPVTPAIHFHNHQNEQRQKYGI